METVSGVKFSLAKYSGNEELHEVEYRRLLAENGLVHAVDVPDRFDHSQFFAKFGEFYPGPSGKLIDDIAPEAGMDDVYYGSNSRSLLPHTEGYEFEGLPPRYLALWCVTPHSGNGGETTLFDARPIVDELSPEERAYFTDTIFDWVSSEGLRRNGLGQRASHPILEDVDGTVLLRFSCNNLLLDQSHESAASFVKRTKREFERGHTAVTYLRNDFLHWDNWRVLHSRNAFTDRKRHLKRVQIRDLSDTREPVGGR